MFPRNLRRFPCIFFFKSRPFQKKSESLDMKYIDIIKELRYAEHSTNGNSRTDI
jgi:hypothetical protein